MQTNPRRLRGRRLVFVVGVLGALMLVATLRSASNAPRPYVWCPHVSNVALGDGLRAVFTADPHIDSAKLDRGALVTAEGVIVAGENVLTIERAVVWDDLEANPSFLPLEWTRRLGARRLAYEFGKGNRWANWHLDVYTADGSVKLHEAMLQGPGLSPSGKCEWVDDKDYKPQTLTYRAYGVWDWDWEEGGVRHDEVLISLWEGDRGIGNDRIGYFLVRRADTVLSGLALSDTDYPRNPSGHDVDLVFRTTSYNVDQLGR